MNLKAIYLHIKQAEEALAQVVQEEEQRRTGKPIMYAFVYEQTYEDAPGWGPNCQYIEARDIEEAFCAFGMVVRKMGLTVRDIRYGFYDEMHEELERIREYWSQYHEERKAGKL